MPASSSLLAPSLAIQPSQLYVKNLQKLTDFYKNIVGLSVLHETQSHLLLGHGTIPVLELISKPEYKTASIRSAGLFHNAILFSSRGALARTLFGIFSKAPESFEGSADHLVSEAFYFHDPENNGLELYFDRPESEWSWSDGMIHMDTLYLDPQQFILDHIAEDSPLSTTLGHVHLRVGDVSVARQFYVNRLGFDLTANLGGAAFVSVGGYHHHLAMNTWFSQGAGPRDPALGLAEVKLILPNDGSIDRLANRLDDGNVAYEHIKDQLHVQDPWKNQLVFTT